MGRYYQTTSVYVWKRVLSLKDQNEHLRDLESQKIDSIIVKVAAIGLDKRHLGKSLTSLREHLEQLQVKFGVHPAGEEHVLETYSRFFFPTLYSRVPLKRDSKNKIFFWKFQNEYFSLYYL